MSIKYSEMNQDDWVIGVLNSKKNGTFVDIGCSVPFLWNNTAKLEKEYGWSGIAIDLNPHDNQYKIDSESRGYSSNWSDRPNSKVIQADALKVNYKQLFSDYGMPHIIDYLSIDINPPENNWHVFKAIPHGLYKFRAITFEHDDYRMHEGWREKTIDMICSFGYKHIMKVEQDDYYIYPGV